MWPTKMELDDMKNLTCTSVAAAVAVFVAAVAVGYVLADDASGVYDFFRALFAFAS